VLRQHLSVLDSRTTTAEVTGRAYASPDLSTRGYVGSAWIAIAETPVSGSGEISPNALWYQLNVC
jgi:hypothetical protein